MGHKKVKSHKRRLKRDSLSDVALSDFADAQVPRGSGRVRKSKSVLPIAPPIEEADDEDDEGTQILSRKAANISIDSKPADQSLGANADSHGLLLPDEIWIFLSEYMRPQDVVTFSLICRSSYRIVNSPLFWIKLYKRYYTSKVYVPTFLKKHCLERHSGLKAKVVRSLFYTYPTYHKSLRKPNNSLKSLIGQKCELMWVQRASDKEINANNSRNPIIERWVYSFKLSSKPDDDRGCQPSRRKAKENINYNPDENCRLLEVICKEYIDPKCVIGMKLRSASVSIDVFLNDLRCVHLKFSSAPLSRFGTDFGAIDLYLQAIQPPSIYDWWHPHFYNQQY